MVTYVYRCKYCGEICNSLLELNTHIINSGHRQRQTKRVVKKQTNKTPIIIGCILFFILLLLAIFSPYTQDKTSPEDVFNYTHGKFTITQHNPMSFLDYYSMLLPDEYDYRFEKLEIVQIPIYGLEVYEPEYYNYCQGKKIEINFTNSSYSEFQFNYKDKTFNYTVNLYPDLYYFSDNLKNQDCYFDTYKYTEGYLEDPYNNRFMDAVSNDFISLKNQGYTDDEILEIATVFVQSITYGTDYTDLNRYPYETFYEKEGNCLDKSLILVDILKNLNYTSYIILGDSDEEYHSIVGVVCDDGNIVYQGKEICYIETTVYTPISSEVEIDIEEYIKTSEGSKVYKSVNYGNDIFEVKYLEIENINFQMESLDKNEIKIQYDMCETDCVVCEKGIIDWFESDTIDRCSDYKTYNRLYEEYINEIEEYNLLLEDWYKIYYDLEKFMFWNIELIERD